MCIFSFLNVYVFILIYFSWVIPLIIKQGLAFHKCLKFISIRLGDNFIQQWSIFMQIRNRADNVIDFMYALNISLFIFPSSGIRALRCIGGRVVCMNQHKLYTPRGAINLKKLLQLVGISNDSRVSSLFGSNVSLEYCSYHDCKNKSPVAKCDTLFCRFTNLKIKAIFFHISFTFPTSYMSRTRCISQKRVVIEIIGYTFFQRKSNNS